MVEDIEPVEEIHEEYFEEIPMVEDLEPEEEIYDEGEEIPMVEDLEPEEESEEVAVDQTTLEELEQIDFSKYETFNPMEEEELESETENSVEPVQETQETPINVVPIPVVIPNPTPQVQTPQMPQQPQYTPQVTPIPQPMPVQQSQYFYNAYGEAIPITYNAQNQPVFAVPVTYDMQGQPRPMQVQQQYVQPTPMPQPQYMSQGYSQPTYIQPQSVPVSPMQVQPTYTQPVQTPQQPTVPTTPPPTRIVRNDAPPLISNPADKKPFDFSVFEKENNKPVFTASDSTVFVDSIEEALNQLGIETESSQKNQSEDITPDFQEYKIPTKTKQKSTPKVTKEEPVLSEAERKKKEKIDAKFKKDLEKRGIDTSGRFKFK
jgi:hypothetical protein